MQQVYYRINTIHLPLPPLRERIEDLIPLIDYLIDKYMLELDRSDIAISSSAQERLRNYNWPGNIRELENVIKRAIILLDKNKHVIEAGAFDYLFYDPQSSLPSFNESIDITSKELIAKTFDLTMIEKQILNSVLQRFNGNVMEAARRTNISKDKFYRNR